MNSLRIDLEKPKPPTLRAMVNETHFAPTAKNASLYDYSAMSYNLTRP